MNRLLSLLAVGIVSAATLRAQEVESSDPTKEFAEKVASLRKSYETRRKVIEEEIDKLGKQFESAVKTYRDETIAQLKDTQKIVQATDLDAAIKIRDQIQAFQNSPIPRPRESTVRSGSSERSLRAENADLKSQIRDLEKRVKSLTITSRVPREALSWRGHHYLRIDRPMTRAVAIAYAKSVGGHLARVEDRDEQSFVFNLVKSAPRHWYMIDGSDDEVEGRWIWSSGKQITFFDWDSKEPSGSKRRGQPYQQHDLLINPKNGKMHDGICGERNGFIVEWDD